MGTYTSMRASRQAWDVGIAVRFVALQLDQGPPPFAGTCAGTRQQAQTAAGHHLIRRGRRARWSPRR